MVVKLKAIIHGAKRDQHGEWKLVLAIPQSDALNAAALATQNETVFDVSFKPEENGQ